MVLGAVLAAVTSLLLVVAAPVQALGASGGRDPVGVWPLVPVPAVVRGFEPPSSAWGAGHRGVDLLGAPGQPVGSALPGRVSFVGRVAGRDVVVVDHGATRTTYEPVSATVATGDQVLAGQTIGTLELAGSHCFPLACLHWGWVEGETYLDPLRLVGAGPVRLLPLWREVPVDEGDGAGGSTPSALPYAAWLPLVALLTAVPAQARGCACW